MSIVELSICQKMVAYFWWRCAWGTHPFPSRTRWLRPKRPMVLHWRRCGRVGGRQIYKSLLVIRDLNDFKFLMTGKQSIKYDAKLKNLQFFRSWHYMPIHEKRYMLMKVNFQRNIFSMCSHLYVPWKLHIRNDDKIKYLIKTSEVIVINRVIITNTIE